MILPLYHSPSSSFQQGAGVDPAATPAPTAETARSTTSRHAWHSCFWKGLTGKRDEGGGTRSQGDEGAWRAYVSGVRPLLQAACARDCRMLASQGRRMARELRSPLRRALARAVARFSAAAARLTRGPVVGRRNGAHQLAPLAARGLPKSVDGSLGARAARGLVRDLGRVVGRARPRLTAGRQRGRSRTCSVVRPSGQTPRRLLHTASRPPAGAGCTGELQELPSKLIPWPDKRSASINREGGPGRYLSSLALVGDVAIPLGLCLATRYALPPSRSSPARRRNRLPRSLPWSPDRRTSWPSLFPR